MTFTVIDKKQSNIKYLDLHMTNIYIIADINLLIFVKKRISLSQLKKI